MPPDLGEAYRGWLGEAIPSWSLLPHKLITLLVELDLGPEGGIKVATSLPAPILETIPAFQAVRDYLKALSVAGTAPPTTEGEIDETFLEAIVPQDDHDLLRYVAAVTGLMQLSEVRTQGISLTQEGQELLAVLEAGGDKAGSFFAELVTVTLNTFNLGYLDELGVEGFPQTHIPLVLFLLDQVAREPKSAAELARLTSLPTDIPQEALDPAQDMLTQAFELRALRYLAWFGCLERSSVAGYRLTPLFDNLFSFNIPDIGSEGTPN